MAGRRIDEIKIKLILETVQNLRPQNAILHPAEARDVKIFGFASALAAFVFFRALDRKNDPGSLAALCIDDTKTHYWIRITGFGIFLTVHAGMREKKIGYGVGGHRGL